MNLINMIPVFDTNLAFQAIAVILSISLLITSMEEISGIEIFQSNGLLTFKVSKYNLAWLSNTTLGRIFQCFLEDTRFLRLLYIKTFSSILFLILSLFNIIPFWLVALLLAFNILVSIRSPYGLDGAHQLSFLILLSLAIATYFGIDSEFGVVSLYFIAFQLILSYVIAGIAKAISPLWKGPYALLLIFSTRIYGNNFLFQMFKKHKSITAFLSIFIIILELSFASVLFLPLKYAIFFCIAGFGFHLFNAIFMGLNTFFFTFIAAYPALIFYIQRIHA